MCKFDPDYVSEVKGGGKLLVAVSLGDAWGISRIRLPGSLCWLFNSKSEDWAKRVRV